jgi:penicillin amidase
MRRTHLLALSLGSLACSSSHAKAPSADAATHDAAAHDAHVEAARADAAHDASVTYPAAAVTLEQDSLGITHVFAQSDADAFYGAGYAMARDRILQMELNRRQAAGTSSELFGAGSVDDDLSSRMINFAAIAQASYALMQKETPNSAEMVDAWTAGVNARLADIRSGKAPVPYGFGAGELGYTPTDWAPYEGIMVGKLLSFGLSDLIDQKILATAILRLAPTFGADYPFLQPSYNQFTLGQIPAGSPQVTRRPKLPAPSRAPMTAPPRRWFSSGSGFASNNFGVTAAVSANGHPMLAGDPHQGPTSPMRFWPLAMNSMAGGGTLDVVGFAFAGTPGVELGMNENIGWTGTTNFADAMDLWSVNFSSDGTSVVLGDGTHPMTSRTEVINVRTAGAPYGTNTAQSFTLEDVPGYGTIIPSDVLPVPQAILVDGDGILFRWVGATASDEFSGFLAIDRAKTTADFEAGVDLMAIGAENLLAIDASHLDYHVHANIPDRGVPSSHPMPWRILDGSEADTLWTGAMLPASELPAWVDPARGYITTGNNDPWGFTADGNVEDDPFYYGAYYADGIRAERIAEQLESFMANGQKVAEPDMEALQDDTYALMADTILPLLATGVAAIGTDPSLASYVGRTDLTSIAADLAGWDRTMSRTEGVPIAFAALEWFLAARVYEPSLPTALFSAVCAKSSPFFVGQLRNVLASRFAMASTYVGTGGMNALLVGALSDTSAWLTSAFKTTDTKTLSWGSFNQIAWDNPVGGSLDVAPEGIDGTNDTVKVAEATFFAPDGGPAGTMAVNNVSNYRMVIQFANGTTPSATLDFARGASGEPTSPYFGNADPAWVAGTHVPLPFAKGDVDDGSVGTVVLPKG